MLIKIKKNRTLIFKKFEFRCAIGRSGFKKNKKEGDGATPKGTYSFGKLYYRADRIKKIHTYLKCKKIKKIWDGVTILMTKNTIKNLI